jgi:hypothetical protein
MKSRLLAACVITLSIGTSSSAFAAPGGQAIVTKFKTTSSVVFLSADDGVFQYSLTAQNYDDMDGIQQGIVSFQIYRASPYFIGGVTCQGPAYANTVAVNRSTGVSSVNVLLDPKALGCENSFNSSAVTIAVTGVPIGNYHESETGSKTIDYGGGSMEKTSFQSEYFDENFSGSIGYSVGPISGNAQTAKVTSRTKVK